MIADLIASTFAASPRRFQNATLENPAVSLQDPAAIEQLGGTMAAASGARVNHQTAISLAPVRQAVRLISCDISKMKLYPYKHVADDEREIVKTHPAYVACAFKANPWKTAARFWRDLMVHSLLWENGYAYITRNRFGKIELYNLLPDRTSAEWYHGELIYATEVDGKIETLWPSEVLHIVGLSLDGTAGSDLVKDARDSIGLALSRRNFESKFFKNGARLGGILTLPTGMTKPARDTVEEGFSKTYEQGDNPFKTVILREGAKFDSAQSTLEQAQVVEAREADKRDIASFFELPPSKLGIRDSKSYNSFEQDNLSYLQGCLHHWADTISDECDFKLTPEKDWLDGEVAFEHDYSEFITADFKTLAEALGGLRDREILNPNEVRAKLRYNRRKDPGGDKYENPNTRPASASQGASEPAKSAKPVKNSTIARQKMLAEQIGRMVRRTSAQARKLSGDAAAFLKWIDGGADEQRQAFDEAMLPILGAMVEASGAEGMIAQLSNAAFTDGFLAQIDGLRKLTEPPNVAEDLKANVEKFLNQFERTAPDAVASHIVQQIPAISVSEGLHGGANIAMPAMTIAIPEQPPATVQNNITMPDQPPATVNFAPAINVPEQPTPSVTNNITVPEQPPAVVNFTIDYKQLASAIVECGTASTSQLIGEFKNAMRDMQKPRKLKIKRDANGDATEYEQV